jgi:hypothetical protein
MSRKHDGFKAQKSASLNRQFANRPDRVATREPYIVLTFRNLDRQQGQSFQDWEVNKLLATAMEKLRAVCSLTVKEATTEQIIKRYDKLDGKLPDGSAFYHPPHIPADIIWCSMHIQGKECVIGFFEEYVFHVVFLDMDHEFWPSKKKHT